jgi:hypothetical protein
MDMGDGTSDIGRTALENGREGSPVTCAVLHFQGAWYTVLTHLDLDKVTSISETLDTAFSIDLIDQVLSISFQD